MFIVNKLGS